MSKTRLSTLLTGTLGVALLLAVAGTTAVRSQESHPSGIAAKTGSSFGVVNMQKVLATHKSYKDLTALDKEIERLATSLSAPPEADPRLQKEVQKQLDALQQQFKVRYTVEIQKSTDSLKAQQAAMQQQLEAMASGMSQKLKQDVDSLPKEPKGPPPMPKNFATEKVKINTQMGSYIQDLALVRQRQLASKRLELQHQAEQALATKKAAMERDLSDYEAQLLQESQQQKVNLELAKISAKSDDERQKIEDQLNAIKSSQDQKRQARRDELSGQFDAQKKTAFAQVDAQLKTYQARVDSDTQAQVNQEQKQLVHQYLPNALTEEKVAAEHAQQQAVAPKIQALKAEQAAMKAQFEKRKDELSANLQAQNAEVKAHLQQRYKDMKKEFDEQAKAIIQKVAAQQKAEGHDDKAKLANIKKELEAMQGQRQRLFEQMEADVKIKVETIARRDNIDVVVGDYLVHNCKDLTADVLKAMAQ